MERQQADHGGRLRVQIRRAVLRPCWERLPQYGAAGAGFKEGFYTDRIIRQIDVAPTVAVMAGVRMPAQCEGAPIYQIFAEEF